jgi:hypothetical protein
VPLARMGASARFCAQPQELERCIRAWDRAWLPSLLLCGTLFRWPLEWRWRGGLAMLLAEARLDCSCGTTVGLMARSGFASQRAWPAPRACRGAWRAMCHIAGLVELTRPVALQQFPDNEPRSLDELAGFSFTLTPDLMRPDL